MVLKNKLFKNILYQGLILLSLGIILSVLYSFYYLDNPVKSKLENIPLGLFVVAAIVIAPIIEEFVFRGVFFENKINFILSIIGLGVFIWMNKPVLIYAYIIYLFIILINSKTIKSKRLIIYSYSFLFSILHLEFSKNTGSFLQNVPAFLNRFGFSLIAFYLMINYGLLKSILLHFLNNLIVISILLIGLTFSNSNKVIKSELNSINYSIVSTNSILSKNSKVTLSKNEIIAKNITVTDFLKLLSYNYEKDIITIKNYFSTSPFLQYNFSFKSKEDLKIEELLKVLEKHKLINHVD